MTAGLLTFKKEDPDKYSEGSTIGSDIFTWTMIIILSPIIMPIVIGSSNFYSQEVNKDTYYREKEKLKRLFKDDE